MSKKDKKQKAKSNAWTPAGTFQTFNEADSKRKKIAENPKVQTKIRRRHSKNNFTVHYRELMVPKKKGEKED